jgi:hypothetical protein
MSALLVSVAPACARASTSTDDYYNVALVIDGSGSLNPDLVGSEATDPSGVRYDAISLFLGLLANDGNNVDAIVFDDNPSFLLNTGLQALAGRDAKVALAGQIEAAGAVGDTDIGTALLTAVNVLAEQGAQNGLNSVVILFSDGRTDLGTDEEAYNTSVANKESAIAKAQEANIPIYTICLQATDVADPAELQSIAERTSGDFIVVTDASGLSGAFESFYSLIFPTSSAERVDATYDENGEFSYQINVPSYGAREVNVIVNSANTSQVVVQSPSRVLGDDEVANSTITGGEYSVIKLVDPEVGVWNLTLRGTPGDQATVNVIYNVDTTASIATSTGDYEFADGTSANLVVRLYQDGVAVEDPAVTQEYTANLTLENLTTGASETVQMSAGDNGAFVYDLQETGVASYRAYATLTGGDVQLETGSVELSFSNTAPTLAKGATVSRKVVVTPFSGGSTSFDLTEYFKDEQDGTNLNYAVVSSQLVAGTASLDGSVLNVNTASSKSGEVVLQATDSQGSSAQMTVRLKVVDTRPIFATIVAAVVVAVLAIVLVVWYRKTHTSFKGTAFVRNADSSQAAMNANSTRPVRGKIPLSRFAVQGSTGFDPKKSYVVATSGHTLEFRSDTLIYQRSSSGEGDGKKRVVLQNGDNVLYSDAKKSKGIRIEVQPRDRSRPAPRPRS